MAQYCVYCGAQLHDEGSYCRECGKPKTAAINAAAAVKPVILTPETERTFFQDANVVVTNLWFRVPGQAYPMSEVAGVRIERSETKTAWPNLLFLLGLAVLFEREYPLGLGLLIVGAFLRAISRPKYTIVLCGTGGEVRAFTGDERDYITDISDALNKALAYGR